MAKNEGSWSSSVHLNLKFLAVLPFPGYANLPLHIHMYTNIYISKRSIMNFSSRSHIPPGLRERDLANSLLYIHANFHSGLELCCVVRKRGQTLDINPKPVSGIHHDTGHRWHSKRGPTVKKIHAICTDPTSQRLTRHLPSIPYINNCTA
jgi:hypothetical protein